MAIVVWASARALQKKLSKLSMALVVLSFMPLGAEATNSEELDAIFSSETSRNSRGNRDNEFSLERLVSCSYLDRVPWNFQSLDVKRGVGTGEKRERKIRMIIRDRLSLGADDTFYLWEIHQVIDPNNSTSFVFRRRQDDGSWYSIVAKDSVYNRFIEKSRDERVLVEERDLKSLIDRPVLTFYNQARSTLSFMPSSMGNSALVVQLVQKEGRQLPPVFIRGSTCARPKDDSNEGATDPLIPGAVPAL